MVNEKIKRKNSAVITVINYKLISVPTSITYYRAVWLPTFLLFKIRELVVLVLNYYFVIPNKTSNFNGNH